MIEVLEATHFDYINSLVYLNKKLENVDALKLGILDHIEETYHQSTVPVSVTTLKWALDRVFCMRIG